MEVSERDFLDYTQTLKDVLDTDIINYNPTITQDHLISGHPEYQVEEISGITTFEYDPVEQLGASFSEGAAIFYQVGKKRGVKLLEPSGDLEEASRSLTLVSRDVELVDEKTALTKDMAEDHLSAFIVFPRRKKADDFIAIPESDKKVV